MATGGALEGYMKTGTVIAISCMATVLLANAGYAQQCLKRSDGRLYVSSSQRIGRCFIEVDKRMYVDGPCTFSHMGDELLSIGEGRKDKAGVHLGSDGLA